MHCRSSQTFLNAYLGHVPRWYDLGSGKEQNDALSHPCIMRCPSTSIPPSEDKGIVLFVHYNVSSLEAGILAYFFFYCYITRALHSAWYIVGAQQIVLVEWMNKYYSAEVAVIKWQEH